MWITVDEVQKGYKQLESPKTESEILNLILESQEIIEVDLSGSVDVEDAENIRPFPKVLQRLCILKTREKSLAFYYQSNIDANVEQCRKEYDDIIDDVRKGNIIINMAIEPEPSTAGLGSVTFG